MAMWMNGYSTDMGLPTSASAAERLKTESLQMRVKELEHRVSRLSLLNQALWELLTPRLNLTEAELQQKISEIDLRDGVEDGGITEIPLQCPNCGRISNSRHWKCLYCGQEFERPVSE